MLLLPPAATFFHLVQSKLFKIWMKSKRQQIHFSLGRTASYYIVDFLIYQEAKSICFHGYNNSREKTTILSPLCLWYSQNGYKCLERINKIEWIGEELLLVSQYWRTVFPNHSKTQAELMLCFRTSLFNTASYLLCGRAGHHYKKISSPEFCPQLYSTKGRRGGNPQSGNLG